MNFFCRHDTRTVFYKMDRKMRRVLIHYCISSTLTGVSWRDSRNVLYEKIEKEVRRMAITRLIASLKYFRPSLFVGVRFQDHPSPPSPPPPKSENPLIINYPLQKSFMHLVLFSLQKYCNGELLLFFFTFNSLNVMRRG